MTGPPTPPPTSQTEIEDAARISAPAQPIPEIPAAAEPPTAAPQPQQLEQPEQPAQQAAVSEPSEPIVVPPTQPVAPYQTAFASIQQSSANGNYAELIRIAEEEDMLVNNPL